MEKRNVDPGPKRKLRAKITSDGVQYNLVAMSAPRSVIVVRAERC